MSFGKIPILPLLLPKFLRCERKTWKSVAFWCFVRERFTWEDSGLKKPSHFSPSFISQFFVPQISRLSTQVYHFNSSVFSYKCYLLDLYVHYSKLMEGILIALWVLCLVDWICVGRTNLLLIAQVNLFSKFYDYLCDCIVSVWCTAHCWMRWVPNELWDEPFFLLKN